MTDQSDGAEPRNPVARAAERVGVAGGLISIFMALLVTGSVLGRWLFDQGVPGDFEFVQMGTAVSVFFFLVACQAKRGNIVVDTFTGFLNERGRNRLDAFWDVVYGLVMAFLTYCMILGTAEAYKSGTATMVLLLPQWPALLIATIVLGLLAAVCFWTARRLWGAS